MAALYGDFGGWAVKQQSEWLPQGGQKHAQMATIEPSTVVTVQVKDGKMELHINAGKLFDSFLGQGGKPCVALRWASADRPLAPLRPA